MRISQTMPHLLCLAVLAGCANHNFTQASLAGTWVSEWNFIHFTNTIEPDGSYVCDRVHTVTNGAWLAPRTVHVQTKGTWKIKGALVVNTTTNVTGGRLKTLPVAYGHIKKLDPRELVIKWDNNDDESVWKKKK